MMWNMELKRCLQWSVWPLIVTKVDYASWSLYSWQLQTYSTSIGPGISLFAYHYSTWCRRSMMDFQRTGAGMYWNTEVLPIEKTWLMERLRVSLFCNLPWMRQVCVDWFVDWFVDLGDWDLKTKTRLKPQIENETANWSNEGVYVSFLSGLSREIEDH